MIAIGVIRIEFLPSLSRSSGSARSRILGTIDTICNDAHMQ